ncbi:MAG: alpha-L-rhamnosidase C-terminal domain-containing protein [Bacteroidia bacterium]|nr:alpha-L-rhamnosidase C-terminal domain-containing protein [Bacteroidia bacterium]
MIIKRVYFSIGFVLIAFCIHAQNNPTGLMTDLLKNTDKVFIGGYPSSVELKDIDSAIEPVQTAKILSEYPMFSWIVPDNGKNTMQSSYRIIVSDSLHLAQKSIGNIWDSGAVNSAKSVSVAYSGNPLQSNRLYYWRVRVVTNNGGESEWSEIKSFRAGDKLKPYQFSSEILIKSAENPVTYSNRDDIQLFDFRKASFGQLLVRLTSETGNDTVIVNLGEKVKDGRVDARPGGTIRYQTHKLALLKGTHFYRIKIHKDRRNTLEVAVKMPDYIGEVVPFRYAEVLGYNKKLEKTDIVRESVHYPFDESASFFRCDNDILNQIWEMCKYTMKATSFAGVYVDGDRERIPYEADIIINQLSHYGVDREYSIARKSLEHSLEKPTWPTEWILQAIIIAWYDYMYTGDTRSLEKNYTLLKNRSLNQLKTDKRLISTKTDLLTKDLMQSFNFNDTIRDIVDWPLGERDGFVFCDYNSVVNAFYYEALKIMEQIALLLDKKNDALLYAKARKDVYKIFNDTFFDPKQKLYVDGDTTSHTSLHSNMFAYAFGLVPEKFSRGVQDFIKSRGMACSVYGAQFLMDALYDGGNGEYAEKLLVSTDERSWYNMIRAGSTVALEAWDIKYKPNLDWNHAWGAVPANTIARYVIGVKPSSSGFETVDIKPHIYNLASVESAIPTIRGNISLTYKKINDNEYLLSMEIPSNTQADMFLPVTANKHLSQLFLNGKKINVSKGRKEPEHVYVGKIGSGKYEYRVILRKR